MIDKFQYSVCPSAQSGTLLSQSWLNYFCRLVLEVASKSKDPSTHVGAIAIDPESKRILATGYNGFPAGVNEDPTRWERPTKYDFVVHAEANVIAAAAQFGISLKGAALFVSMHPCVECAKLIAASGIRHIYYITDDLKKETSREWVNHLDNAISIFQESGIDMIPIEICEGEWVTDKEIGSYDTLRSSPDHFCYKPYTEWVADITSDSVRTSRGKEILLFLTDACGNETTYVTYQGHWRKVLKWQWYGFQLEPKTTVFSAFYTTFRGNVNKRSELDAIKGKQPGDLYFVAELNKPCVWTGTTWEEFPDDQNTALFTKLST